MMKHLPMKCTRWQSRLLTRLLCLPAALLFLALPVLAQTDAVLSPIGGGGGGQFVARCPQGQLLTGFELRTGDDVDAIRPLCIFAYGPRETSAAPLTTGSGLIDTSYTLNGNRVNRAQLEGGWYGGTGGGLRNIICPRDAPIVTGMYVRAEGVDTVIVNNIHLFCGLAATTQKSNQFPSAVFDGPDAHHVGSAFGIGTNTLSSVDDTQRCPAGLVAVGISGRSGVWLDAVGLICGPPKLTPDPATVKSIGRVKVPPASPSDPAVSICERARQARARNSPAAPNLEAQCRAATP